MKTSNKTNSRFSGIIVVMVLSLASTNLNAQKHYHKSNLSILGRNILSTLKTDFLHAIDKSDLNYSVSNREISQCATLIPTEWNANETLSKVPCIQKDEMILEDWMISNLPEINNNGIETDSKVEELNLESTLKNNETLEEDLQIEDWMLNSASLNLNVE